jgi:hypothetical protein
MKTAIIAIAAVLSAACGPMPEQAWEDRVDSKVFCDNAIRDQLRDPKSFDAIRHLPQSGSILVEFRARNGFGGLNVGTAICTPDGEGAKAVLISS